MSELRRFTTYVCEVCGAAGDHDEWDEAHTSPAYYDKHPVAAIAAPDLAEELRELKGRALAVMDEAKAPRDKDFADGASCAYQSVLNLLQPDKGD